MTETEVVEPEATESYVERVKLTSKSHTSYHHPDAWPWIQQAMLLYQDGQIFNAVASHREAVRHDPDEFEIPTTVIGILDQLTDDPDIIMGERRAYDAKYPQMLVSRSYEHTNVPDPDRPLRVGYISGDFYDHSASVLYSEILENHDPVQIKGHLYMTSSMRDHMTKQFRRLPLRWHAAYKQTPEELADQIYKDKIDILVDLAGYTKGNRVKTLVQRPAPIQVTAWGSAMGTGLSCVDYLVSDEVMIPPEYEHLYHEQILRVPSLFGYHRRCELPPLEPPPFEENGFVTFGYFGRSSKITHETLMA